MSQGERDLLGRRSRLSASSTGKRVSPTSRDLLWFFKIAEHGPLPSSFLLEYSRSRHKSDKRAKERLTDLFNEANTPHGGPYLVRPPQQFRTIDSRYNQLVYDLAPAALQALLDQEGGETTKRARSGPWLHSFMVSCITSSIELGCLERDNLSYIPQSRILARAGTDLRYPTLITNPATGYEYQKDLIPDAIFGLEYHTGAGSRFRFFAVEADRATEPATSSNFNRKSFDRHLRQYQAYVEGKLYQEHLQLTAPVLVLNITTNTERKALMLKLTWNQFLAGNTYQMYQTWEKFGPIFKPPTPNLDLLSNEWHRAGFETAFIDRF